MEVEKILPEAELKYRGVLFTGEERCSICGHVDIVPEASLKVKFST